MSTLFTFGCSLTKYKWKTWADHLGKNFNTFKNYGRIGCGNQYILFHLTQSHAKKEIKKTDTVAIMWTSHYRYDTWKNGDWECLGNYWNHPSEKSYHNNIDPIGFFIRDCSFIQNAKLILDDINCRYVFFSMLPFQNISKYSCIEMFSESIKCIKPSVFETLYNFNWYSRSSDLVIDSADDFRYNKLKGKDWPTLSSLKNKKFFISEKIKKDMCNKLGAKKFNDIIKHKLWIDYDYHPTSNMHLEYLDEVLPNWKSWK